jgi:hypothetical protein
MINERENGNNGALTGPRDQVVRRIRALWAGLAVYTLIMVNGFRLVYIVPYQAAIVGSLVNAAIVVTFVVTLKRAYKRLNT